MIYSSWELERDRLKLVVMGQFLPLNTTPALLKTQNIRILKKKKTLLEISFYTCTKNHNHMRYGFWDRVRQTDFLVCLGHFLPLKKSKMHMIHTFYIYIPKLLIMWCSLPEIWVQYTIFCHFGWFFALLPHYWPQKLKIEKNKKIFPFWNVHNK